MPRTPIKGRKRRGRGRGKERIMRQRGREGGI